MRIDKKTARKMNSKAARAAADVAVAQNVRKATIPSVRPTAGRACEGRASTRIDLFDTELLPTSWMANGNCTDTHPSVFFPRDGVGVIAAQQICEGCPVAEECLEYALRNHISHGVWGGASERQRRRILSERRRLKRAEAGERSGRSRSAKTATAA